MTEIHVIDDLLTKDHFARFGAIIHAFARLEYLIQGAMAAVAGVDDFKIAILTKGLTYSQKRDTLYSYMLMTSGLKPEYAEKIRNLFDSTHKHNALRNNIAHALWRKGTRPGSIRAGYIDVRFGKGRVVGYDDEDTDYTLDELGEAANELRRDTVSIILFFRESGIAPAIAEKIDRANNASFEEVSAADGKPVTAR